MTVIDKHTFLKHFVPTDIERKRTIRFENGSSIKVKYKSEFKYYVKYLPGNRADYYSPNFLFNTEKDLKIIPVPNYYSFIFIPLVIAILMFYEEITKENIWIAVITLILFITLMQFVLIYPSIQNIKKRVNEIKFKN
ncbi:MAG: hypothetical protein AB3N10_10905 [Allomuricauda sp.]